MGEVADRIPGQPLLEMRDDGMRRGRSEAERVAVGRGTGAGLRADDAAAARPVLHHHRLAEFAGQRYGEQPRHDVGAATRGEGDDDAHGAIGIDVLRQRRTGQGKKTATSRQGRDDAPRQLNHRILPMKLRRQTERNAMPARPPWTRGAGADARLVDSSTVRRRCNQSAMHRPATQRSLPAPIVAAVCLAVSPP